MTSFLQEADGAALLETWAKQAESFSEALPRDLALLEDIESVLSAVQFLQDAFLSLSRYYGREAQRLVEVPGRQKWDLDGSRRKRLLRTQTLLKEFRANWVRCRESAREDKSLREEDGVADAYDRLIQVTTDLHNTINALRWANGEHDADLAKAIARFGDLEKLTAHLNALPRSDQ